MLSSRWLATALTATALAASLGLAVVPPAGAAVAGPGPSAPPLPSLVSGKSSGGGAAKVPSSIVLRPVTAYGSQKTLDKCKLVLWDNNPKIIAGHDYCGYSYFAKIPVGRKVTVASGPAKGTYKVYSVRITTLKKGASYPSFFRGSHLILQTCVSKGTGFALAKRVK